VERVNAEEDELYGDGDLPEVDIGKRIDSETLKKTIDELNQKLSNLPEDPELKAAVKKMEENYLPRQRKYEEQERKLAGRNSYAMSDEDATSMRMKEDRGAEKPWQNPHTMCS
jgi:hypothetical protein